jgi:cobalamin transport system substrate-binding protein
MGMATATATPSKPGSAISLLQPRWLQAAFSALGVLLGLGLGLVACGADSTPATAPLVGGPVPQRVIVIGPSSAETLVWLGFESSVIGVSDYCSAPELADRVKVGGQLDPNLERITSLQPDLVIVQGAHPRLKEWCARSGVAFLSWKTQSIASWHKEVLAYGARFGALDRCEDQLADWDAEYARFAAPNGSALRPRALIVASRDPERIARVLAAGRGSFLGELLEHVGGANFYADHTRDYFDLAEEVLLRVKPEIIFELGGEQSDPARLELWREAFSQLPAVRDGRVYGLTEDFVFLPGPRMLDTARLLRAKLSER